MMGMDLLGESHKIHISVLLSVITYA